jgi:cytidyltransferase-like protein
MVLADGCFDPIHCGHLAYLRAASTWGRPLVVNIAPDSAIYEKGRRPFQTRQERAQLILSLDMVDGVRCDDLAAVVRTLRPTWLVKGPDWRGRLPVEVKQACHDVGCEIGYTETQRRTSRERLSAEVLWIG